MSLPAERTLVVNRNGATGKVQEALHRLWGVAPLLYYRVRRLDPVLVHAHFGLDGVKALPLARNLRVPLLVSFHGFDATVKDEHARRAFYGYRVYLRHRDALKREARLFIAVSGFIRERLLEQGFPPDRTVVHYIGVDTGVFRPDPSIKREPVVLFVGRMVEKKGCEYLIRAMAQVEAALPDAELVLIGDGPLRANLEELAAESLKRYKFLGVQPLDVVRGWMNRALLLCAPSVTASTGDSEGLPTSVLEAQAMELPVVSTIHSGIPEAVVHGETGFLADERDWEALAGYIVRLMEDASLWRRFSQKGRERARTLFDLTQQIHALEEIYAAVLHDERER